MSRKSYLFVLLAIVAMFALACGDSNPPQFDTGSDEGQPDTVTHDTINDVVDVVEDTHDTATPDVVVDTTDDGGADVVDVVDVVETDETPVDVISDVEPDVVDTYVPPLCPCDTTVNEPVCGVDETTYTSATCAACELCQDAPDCLGCHGDIACTTSGNTNFLLRRTSCDVCPCTLKDECDLQFQPMESCGIVCAMDGVTEYADLCALKTAKGCPSSLDDFIGAFGECVDPVCVGCEGVAEAPVCGSDGKTYKNKCEFNTCPSTTGLTRVCEVACEDASCPY